MAVVLVVPACTVRKSYGVSTQTEAVTGSCDHSRIVEIGAALDLSGPNGTLGHRYLLGLEQAVRQIDGTGGILKSHACLELLYKDDRGNSQIGDHAVLDLVNNEVVTFLVAPFESATVRASGADLGLAGVPTVGLSSLDETGAPNSYPMMFPVVPSGSTSAGALARYAASQHWTAVGVRASDDAAGRQEAAELRSALQGAGVGVTAVTYASSTETSAVTWISAAAGGGPQIVAGGDAAMAASGAAAADGTRSVLVPKGVVVTGAGGPTDPALRQFLAAQNTTSDEEAALLATAAAYDGVEMLAYAADSQNSTRAGDVRTFLENATYQGVLGVYSYSADRHTGLAANQLTVVPQSTAAGGLFHTTTP